MALPSKMRACVFDGAESMKMVDKETPTLQHPKDIIVRIIASTVCGTDLHLYHNEMAGLRKGDVLGHEGLGIVEQVGADVHMFHRGDKVLIAPSVACGECFYCKKQQYSACDVTNPNKQQEQSMGHRTAGLIGHSNITGGYQGTQAEFVRVAYAEINAFKIDDDRLTLKQLLPLCDIAGTGLHGCLMGEVKPGQTVAIWGAGPVGMMIMHWAKILGAAKIIALDPHDHRLEFCKRNICSNIVTVNVSKQDAVKTVQQVAPNGPDVCIDAVGFSHARSLFHRFQRAVKLETDTPEILYQCIYLVRKGGIVSVIGDYYSTANQFPIGPFMEKGLTMRGGPVHLQSLWPKLMEAVKSGAFDPSYLFTHQMTIEDFPQAYKMMDTHEGDPVKIMIPIGDPAQFGFNIGESRSGQVLSGMGSVAI